MKKKKKKIQVIILMTTFDKYRRRHGSSLVYLSSIGCPAKILTDDPLLLVVFELVLKKKGKRDSLEQMCVYFIFHLLTCA